MKTILYQPIFINPQAYFVFPSLYHIEKGDSFIEPANITGQLIINTLTDDPIILTVKDNNQVDFSIFAGKHIRISQYTDEGAVVLGEWLIPGESAPVYPDWFTSSVKAIYDPKKQGMTNFDVIESYAEDFTTWRYSDSRGTAAVTPNKITITESFDTTNIVEDVEEPYSDISIYVTGVSEDVPLVVRDITGKKAIITKDGKYDFSKNSRFMGFAINKILSNINVVISLLPTSIIKDLSGNGNHAYLYGGKGKLNSGMGIYEVDFTTYYGVLINQHTCKLTYDHKNFGIAYNKLTKDVEPYTVKVTGIRKEIVRFTYRNEEGIEKDILIKNDGYYTVPKCYKDGTQGSSTTFVLYANYDNDTEVIIEQIPDYPNQLCYDGKMYAVCYGFPILTDYTVMAERTWFKKQNGAFISKSNNPGQGAFIFENILSGAQNTYSFAQPNSISIQDGISYQTKNSYNGSSLSVGTGFDNPNLVIGRMRDTSEVYYVGCHGKIIIADRSFTQEEIDWIKENIYNIEI